MGSTRRWAWDLTIVGLCAAVVGMVLPAVAVGLIAIGSRWTREAIPGATVA